MATIAGYNVLFLVDANIRQITMAEPDDRAMEEWLAARYGRVEVMSRSPLDAKTLGLLGLKFGEWLEWAPLARRS
jgi:hypothetical protein